MRIGSALIETDGRVSLVCATIETLDAEDLGPDRLADRLGVAAPSVWPPEHNDAETRAWVRGLLAEYPDQPGCGSWYIVVADRLVGICGYKGPPDALGVVEIGYSVVEPEQRRGYGVAAARLLVARAFRDPRVWTVVGETLPALDASQKVLRACGFRLVGSRPDPDLGEILKFVLDRP